MLDWFNVFGIENFGYENWVVFLIEFILDKFGEFVWIVLNFDLFVCFDVCVFE